MYFNKIYMCLCCAWAQGGVSTLMNPKHHQGSVTGSAYNMPMYFARQRLI
jgi:hypothetical protein